MQRQPLATQNGLSRLPMPSKLKTPSGIKPPQSIKRQRSPGESLGQEEKRRCLDLSQCSDVSDTSTTSQKSDSKSRLRSNSSGNLNSSTTKKTLKPSNSTGSLKTKPPPVNRPPVASKTRPTTTNQPGARKPVTAVVKPTTSKPVVNKPPAKSSKPNGSANTSEAASKASGSSKKRPAWDLKGRLQDMEELVQSQGTQRQMLMIQLDDYNSRIASLESANNQLSGTVEQKEKIATDASRQIDNLRQRLREEEDNKEVMKRNLKREIEDLQFLKDTLQRQKDVLEGEMTAARTEINGLKESIAQMTSSHTAMSAKLDTLNIQLDTTVQEKNMVIKENNDLKTTVASQAEIIENLKSEIREHETTRRKLHNTIQELKGNIRVFCRVRPLLGDERLGNDGVIQHMNFPDNDNKILELEKIGDIMLNESCLTAAKRGNKYEFTFDRVFTPETSQVEVFEEISQLVQSALDGYNVCIFAYGQTGSGKTFTMEGSSVEDMEKKGMIPRAVLQIFETVKELEEKGWQYELEASFLEIYNETIRDLLGNGKDEKHEIKLTGTGSNEVIVTNLTLIPITSNDQIMNLLKKASHNRAVAETKCNEHSSRSHSVFRLKISGKNEITKEACQGTLNLVDLAGSERVKESGSEGQRLKEALSINKSLSNLGNVIMALGNKDSHIPYRNSKLTYLLQNSLGGNSKTLMFVNASPKEEFFQETLNSLRFATKVNQCNIGTAQKKVK